MRHVAAAVAAAALLLGWVAPAAAQQVSLAGQMGSRALLIIDGRSQMLEPGQSAGGVRLIALQGDQAQVSVAGTTRWLRAGAAPVNLAGGAPVVGGREVVISAGPGGHFVAAGAINGRAVRFMVDTGATVVAMGQAEADRLGVAYRGGERITVQTANGAAPAWRVVLNSVRLGDVEVRQVDALVAPAPLPYILLGNSFLARFQMRRDNDVMRLELR